MGQLSSMLGIPASTALAGCPRPPARLLRERPHPCAGGPAPRAAHRPRRCHYRRRPPRRCCPCPAGHYWARWGSCHRRPRRSRCLNSAGPCWGRAGSCPAGQRTGMAALWRLADTGLQSRRGQRRGTPPPARPRATGLLVPSRRILRESAPSQREKLFAQRSPRAAGVSRLPSTATSTFLMPSPSASSSHWSPMPSLSASSCPEFGVRRQLSCRHRQRYGRGHEARGAALPWAPAPAPGHRPPSPGAHLLAVLVVVDAGQGLIWVAVEVRVLPTHVSVASPTHVALRKEGMRGWRRRKGSGRTNCCLRRYPWHPPALPSSCPRSHSPHRKFHRSAQTRRSR